MSNKKTFVTEIEVNASPKMIFPYISTVDGLERWYADSANITPNNVFEFTCDDEHYFAKMQSLKANQMVVFEFLDDEKEEEEDPSILKISIDQNEITNAVYLVIEDYTDLVDSQAEFQELWEGLVSDLKEIIGA